MILDSFKTTQKTKNYFLGFFVFNFPKNFFLKQHNYPFPETSLLLSTLSIVFFQKVKKTIGYRLIRATEEIRVFIIMFLKLQLLLLYCKNTYYI
jgi:hypothetical protein